MPNKRAFIFANGELPDNGWLTTAFSTADILIAADGGLRHLQTLGIPAHLLIGDLDSVSADQVDWARANGAKVERYPVAKNETDLELALLAARKLGCQEILVIAGLGGRLDQTLANLSLLRLPELRDCVVRFEDGREEVFLIHDHALIEGQAGDIVSLLPFGAPVEGVITENLAYPLRHETLYPEHTRGISNVMNSQQARISIASGELLCVHTHHQNSLKEE